jgi:hypothetical protein
VKAKQSFPMSWKCDSPISGVSPRKRRHVITRSAQSMIAETHPPMKTHHG